MPKAIKKHSTCNSNYSPMTDMNRAQPLFNQTRAALSGPSNAYEITIKAKRLKTKA